MTTKTLENSTITPLQQKSLNRLVEAQKEQAQITEALESADRQIGQGIIDHTEFVRQASILLNKSYMVHGEIKGLKLALGID
ncbi:hypothetical protein [cf. Phormidesmis sp. LEGE 11477]|uniref:hypothetical protein n=1 Tax=cf. Phormidesmis sp. LEGE 11477 TaxID=1828680 RepID=UPI00187E2F2D|nr:hypothetical protein [cf. Phormidesmis sp. LEGE 11477]MBE9063299.1 hypothetical protein [cf. Phormidesmis sp. LEGE 11477]